MKVVTVKLPEFLLKKLDELVEAGIFPSRSEAIRTALRNQIEKELANLEK
ncbi:MAG: ribbon-helix-helix domain-containing protein [Candidatus Nezhaarchaeales archaeon]